MKKSWYITAAVTAALVIVCVFCFWRWEQESSDLSFQFEETAYEYKNEYGRVDISYPQMTGSRDKEKERKINQLIEDDIKKVREQLSPEDGAGYISDIGTKRYEISCADEKLISISYVGWVQHSVSADGGDTIMMATTIDCEEMKVLALEDVVDDMEGLSQMLLQDRFEDITAWGGETGLLKMSGIYGYGDEDWDNSYMLLEELNGDDRDIEWYIKERKMSFSEWWSAFWGDDVDRALAGKDFVVVNLHHLLGGLAYNEFAIEMERVRELLREDFVESMLPGSSGESEATAQTPYFFDYGTETVEFEAEFAGTPFGEYEQAKIQVEQEAQGENGILYTLMIESDAEAAGRYSYGGDRFFLGYFYVTEDKIYRMDETGMEAGIKNEEEFPAKGTVVCQETGKEDPLKVEKGWHEKIVVDGAVCTYRSYNDLTETGYYESFVWEKGKGLIEYQSGFGAGKDRIVLVDVLYSK